MAESGIDPVAGTPEAARGAAPRRRSTTAPKGAKRAADKTQRCQLHLGATTVKRLAVHCGMVGRNQSRVADEILTSWLARYGQGKELFPAADTGEDRQEGAAA